MSSDPASNLRLVWPAAEYRETLAKAFRERLDDGNDESSIGGAQLRERGKSVGRGGYVQRLTRSHPGDIPFISVHGNRPRRADA